MSGLTHFCYATKYIIELFMMKCKGLFPQNKERRRIILRD